MEPVSRRNVLRAAVMTASSAALAVATNPIGAAANPRSAPLRRRTFRPLVGTDFTFDDGITSYPGTLTAVVDGNPASDTAFSLDFRAPRGTAPPDGVYAVSHPKLAPFELYVGRIGLPSAGWFEAVVNA